MFNPTSPVTGQAQTGLTSPTYTLTVDTPPNAHSKQFAVSALGGTQTGVNVHSVSAPFTITAERPASFRQLGQPNPITGVVSNVPRNVYVVRTRKGVLPLGDQPYQIMLTETRMSIPAGADTADFINIRAALSAHFGTLVDVSSGLGDTVLTGTL